MIMLSEWGSMAYGNVLLGTPKGESGEDLEDQLEEMSVRVATD
jgi:hypothetical protein